MEFRKIAKSTFAALAIAAAAFAAGCGGGGGGSSASNGFSSTLRLNADLSRISNAIPAGTPVAAVISAISYDTIGNPVMLQSKSISLTYDTADGKYKGDALLSGLTAGTNVICAVEIDVNSAPYAYMGSLIDTLTDGIAADVTVNATTTVKAQTELFYAIAKNLVLSNADNVTAAVKTAIGNNIDSRITSGTISVDDYILASRLPGNPFLPSNWNVAITRKYDANVITSSLGDVIPPRVIDYTPKNGDTIPSTSPTFTVVFSESMDSAINLNTLATLQTAGFSVVLQRPDNGNRVTIDTASALSYGSFSWGTTTVPNDTLIYTVKPNIVLGPGGLAWLQSNTYYDVIQRTMPVIMKDAIGNSMDYRAAFPSTEFPAGGRVITGPCTAGDWVCY